MQRILVVLALAVSALAQKPVVVASFLPKPGSPKERMFEQYILPHVDAVMVRYDWKELEPTPGGFTFDALDADIAKWQSHGKKTAVIVSIVSDTINTTRSNTSTPEWALSQMPLQNCRFIGANQVPIMQDPKTMALTQPFILAVLKHLDTKAPWILYVRIGFYRGGEDTPLCKENQGQQSAVAYLRSMAEFVHQNHSGKTQVVASASRAWPGFSKKVAETLVANDIGIGIQMLSAQDKLNYASNLPCTGDWCEIFKAHPSSYKYLQPEVRQPPSGLLDYYPFAETFGINAIELRVTDLSIAYNPADPNYAEYGAQYRAVLEK